MNLRRLAFVAALLAFMATSAGAQTILADTFQDGDADGWVTRGDVRLTEFAGNVSMRLTKQAEALTAIPTLGYANVTLAVSFAASDLEGEDACILEATPDGGATWYQVHRIEDGQDDAVTLHRGGAAVPQLADQERVVIRIRVDGNADNDTCWADEVVVTGERAQPNPAATGERTDLTRAFLMGEEAFDAPVATAAFAKPVDAQAPSNTFEGQLQVDFGPMAMTLLLDRLDYEGAADQTWRDPPALDIALVQSGDRLIPARRGLIETGHSGWDWIVEPGFVWDEPGDGGMTRAALPVSFQEVNANCTHNGLITFLFDDEGTTSRAAFQIASETCAYFQFDAAVAAPATYAPGPVSDRAALITAHAAEVSGRLTTKPIAALADDHPALDASAFGSPVDVSPGAMTVFGVVIDGVHYRGGCATRMGPHPYCDEVSLPSYSTSKSTFAGLALARLERVYPGAKDALITDYVPACADEGGWEGVTFDHALDMATGRYNSTEREADENNAVTAPFFLSRDHGEKIALACGWFPKREAPGQTWVYHTSDHYILGTAMQAFLREREGPDADIYEDLILNPIFRPLGLSAVTSTTRRAMGAQRQPFVGYGLTYSPDDLAKLAGFFAQDAPTIAAENAVDPDEFAAMLFRNPDDPGLPAAGPDLGYNNGVWRYDIAAYMGCARPTWIPFMSGFGGISVALPPNGIAYYYVSDGGEFRWARGVAATDALRPFCER